MEKGNCYVWFVTMSFTNIRNIWLIYKNNVVLQHFYTVLEELVQRWPSGNPYGSLNFLN